MASQSGSQGPTGIAGDPPEPTDPQVAVSGVHCRLLPLCAHSNPSGQSAEVSQCLPQTGVPTGLLGKHSSSTPPQSSWLAHGSHRSAPWEPSFPPLPVAPPVWLKSRVDLDVPPQLGIRTKAPAETTARTRCVLVIVRLDPRVLTPRLPEPTGFGHPVRDAGGPDASAQARHGAARRSARSVPRRARTAGARPATRRPQAGSASTAKIDARAPLQRRRHPDSFALASRRPIPADADSTALRFSPPSGQECSWLPRSPTAHPRLRPSPLDR